MTSGGFAPGAEEEAEESLEDSDQSEYNLVMFGIRQALPVDYAEPDWDSGPPSTAEEYLRRVRWEAAGLPAVMRAPGLDPQRFEQLRSNDYLQRASGYEGGDSSSGSCPTPSWAVPDPAWVRSFLKDFAALRQQLQRVVEEQAAELSRAGLPPISNVAAWDCICGLAPASPGASPSAGLDGALTRMTLHDPPGPPPSWQGSLQGPQINMVLTLDQVSVRAMLQRIVSRLPGPSADSPRSSHSSESQSALSFPVAQCIFALCARLEKPIHADEAWAMRRVVRSCRALRAGLGGGHDPQLPLLNTLIAIAGAYFGQDEEMMQYVNQDYL